MLVPSGRDRTPCLSAATMSTAHGVELDSPPCDGVSAIAFAAHADVLLVASWDANVRLYDATLNKLRVAFKQRAPVLDAAFMVRRNFSRI